MIMDQIFNPGRIALASVVLFAIFVSLDTE